MAGAGGVPAALSGAEEAAPREGAGLLEAPGAELDEARGNGESRRGRPHEGACDGGARAERRQRLRRGPRSVPESGGGSGAGRARPLATGRPEAPGDGGRRQPAWLELLPLAKASPHDRAGQTP